MLVDMNILAVVFGLMLSFLPMLSVSSLLSRKRYLRAQKTLTFTAGGSDNIVFSGRTNQLNFSLRGDVSRSGTGAVTGKDCLNFMAQMKIDSNLYGTVFTGDGAEAYALSRVTRNSGAFTTCGTATSVTGVGWEMSLPISCQSGETLTINVTWGALLSAGTLITAFTGVLKLDTEILPDGVEPEVHHAFRHHNLGASGVIGGSASYSLAPIQSLDRFQLCGFVIEVNTSAIGTFTNALSSIILTNGAGTYILDEVADLLRHIFGLEIFTTLPTGMYLVTFEPFNHSAETVLTLTNGSTPTVAGTQCLAVYISVHSTDKVITPRQSQAPMPQNPPQPPMSSLPSGSGQSQNQQGNVGLQVSNYLRVPQR